MNSYETQLDGLRKELHDLSVTLHVVTHPRSPAEAQRARHNAEVTIESMTATLQGIAEDLKAGGQP